MPTFLAGWGLAHCLKRRGQLPPTAGGDRDVQVGNRREGSKRPAPGIALVTALQERRRLARRQRNRKRVGRDRQPKPHSLQVRFLARPAIEEGFVPLPGRKVSQRLHLERRKEAFG